MLCRWRNSLQEVRAEIICASSLGDRKALGDVLKHKTTCSRTQLPQRWRLMASRHAHFVCEFLYLCWATTDTLARMGGNSPDTSSSAPPLLSMVHWPSKCCFSSDNVDDLAVPLVFISPLLHRWKRTYVCMRVFTFVSVYIVVYVYVDVCVCYFRFNWKPEAFQSKESKNKAQSLVVAW